MNIDRCPHCNGDSGFYLKYYAYGPAYLAFNFDGTQKKGHDMDTGLTYKYGKVAYCLRCDRKIASAKDMEVQE